MEDTPKVGRPSIYSQELADTICAGLAQGYSLRSVCDHDDMPSLSTIFNWLRTKPDFLQQYARAKEESADALADEMLDIADDARNDWMEREAKGETGWVVNGEHIQRSRVRIDTRKWLASKLKPKKYGDKVETTLTGPNGGAVQIEGVIKLKKPDGSTGGATE